MESSMIGIAKLHWLHKTSFDRERGASLIIGKKGSSTRRIEHSVKDKSESTWKNSNSYTHRILRSLDMRMLRKGRPMDRWPYSHHGSLHASNASCGHSGNQHRSETAPYILNDILVVSLCIETASDRKTEYEV